MNLPITSARFAGLDPAFGNYSPPREGQEDAPVALLDAWYATYPDAGVQRVFAAGVNELVFGQDERGRVADTTVEPFKWATMLEILAADGSRWRGPGWLASSTLVVTAGHCLYMPSRGGWASSIRVRFGVDGDDVGNITKEAAKSVLATDFRSVAGWVQHQDAEADYGAILLPQSLPANYGHFSYAARSDTEFLGAVFDVTGYPADKPPYSQWYFARFSASPTPGSLTYSADCYGGNSGSAIYQYNGGRVACGIHTRGELLSNRGVRITANVAANLSNWTNEAASLIGRR
jgi:glutamyl endopeptidase